MLSGPNQPDVLHANLPLDKDGFRELAGPFPKCSVASEGPEQGNEKVWLILR